MFHLEQFAEDCFWKGTNKNHNCSNQPQATGWILSPEIALESRSVVAYNFHWRDKDNTWAKSQNLCLEKGWWQIASGMCRPSRRLENHMSCISNILGCISYYGVGTLTPVGGNMNTDKYISILDDNLWLVVARHFSIRHRIFQGDNAPWHVSVRAN